jgi:hypothetical protein
MMPFLSVIICGKMVQVLNPMSIEICDPSRLFVEAAPFLALQVA